MAYLLGWDHDAYLLDGLCELVGFHGAIIVQIKIFECFHQHGLLALRSA